jgi:hypothetical protein
MGSAQTQYLSISSDVPRGGRTVSFKAAQQLKRIRLSLFVNEGEPELRVMDQEDRASIRVIEPLQVSPKVSLTLVLKIEASLDWEIWHWSRLDAAFFAFDET